MRQLLTGAGATSLAFLTASLGWALYDRLRTTHPRTPRRHLP